MVATLLLASAPFARAQETINYASIAGRVTDATGAVIPGARVTARQTETNLAGVVNTDREGRFRLSYLRVGPYEMRVHREGFADAIRQLNLTAGAAFELPISLSVAPAETSLLVQGEPAVLETGRSQIAGTVPDAEIQSLPLNGRSFLDVTLLVPGVSPTNTASNQLFAETAAVPGQGISISSQRNFSNSFIVDGLSDNDDAAGLTGAFYGLDVVQEVQVVTSGGQAEFGRALGGYVNVVTKSGSNTLHGDLYGYIRNSRLNAANALSHTVLPMTQAQYGASLAGPIIPDRTFYFANFEQRMLNQSGLVTISPANVAIINARLLAARYPGPAVSTGLYPNPVHTTNFLAKIDHQLAADDQFSVRYSVYHAGSINSRGAGGLSAPTASANLEDTDHIVAISNVAGFSTHSVNETRAQFWSSHLEAPPSDKIGPAVSIAGIASFGTLSGSPTARLNKLGQVVDNFTYQAGAHALRAGVEFIYNGNTITFPRSYRGSYSFSSLANFLAGTYNNSGFSQTFANATIHQTNRNAGFYVQDEWRANSRFTLNLGLRYDVQFLRTIDMDINNLSPRAGFTWTPFAARRTVIRGGYGLFYDRVPLRALANALLSANNTTDPARLNQISVSLSPAQDGAPVFPNILSNLLLPRGVLFNFSILDRHLQNAYSEQGNFEVEQQLGARSSLNIGYQHVRGLHLLVSVNQNPPSCTASGSNNGCRPNPTYGNASQYSSLADSRYDGLQVAFVQRPASWGSYRISYTYSKALDNVGEFFFSSPIDNYNIWRDYGRSDDDQRHRLVLDGSFHSPMGGAATTWQRISRGFQLSGMLQYYSALPFNITTGAQTIQGTAARPVVSGAFIARNAGEGFNFFSLGARLSRSFRLMDRLHLEALAEGFNLTNHGNGVSLNGNFGSGVYPTNPSPTFRQSTAEGDPRAFQLAVRLAF
ncbi:MAG: hypothetical protein C5B51_28230 [Terriglobia bacterium]|nr:MAG: hypothetical protein C5B51_28230 [Terriglobia bacterium]